MNTWVDVYCNSDWIVFSYRSAWSLTKPLSLVVLYKDISTSTAGLLSDCKNLSSGALIHVAFHLSWYFFLFLSAE